MGGTFTVVEIRDGGHAPRNTGSMFKWLVEQGFKANIGASWAPF